MSLGRNTDSYKGGRAEEPEKYEPERQASRRKAQRSVQVRLETKVIRICGCCDACVDLLMSVMATEKIRC